MCWEPQLLDLWCLSLFASRGCPDFVQCLRYSSSSRAEATFGFSCQLLLTQLPASDGASVTAVNSCIEAVCSSSVPEFLHLIHVLRLPRFLAYSINFDSTASWVSAQRCSKTSGTSDTCPVWVTFEAKTNRIFVCLSGTDDFTDERD